MRTIYLTLLFLCIGCRIDSIGTQNLKFKYSIEIENISGHDLKLLSYNRNIKYDSILILKNEIFKKDILYTSNPSSNPQIWLDSLNGIRDQVIVFFENKKSLNTQGKKKFEWLYIYHSNIKPRRGFKWFNPSTDTYNYGTFKYCITKEDYDKADPF
jgi:hypothetical protein